MQKYFILVDKKTEEIVSFLKTTDSKYKDKRSIIIPVKENLKGKLHNYKYDKKIKKVVKFQNKPKPRSIVRIGIDELAP